MRLIKGFTLVAVGLVCGWFIASVRTVDSLTRNSFHVSDTRVPENSKVEKETVSLENRNGPNKGPEPLFFDPQNLPQSKGAPSHVLGSRRPLVRVAGNQLIVRVRNQRLDWIVKEIAQRSGIPIFKDERIANRLVSFAIEGISLDQGLRDIFSGFDLFIFYSSEDMTPRAVWVYPDGEGKRILPVPPELWASTADMEKKLADPDPEQRALSVEALVQRRDPNSVSAVLRALEDGETLVRTRALDAAVNAGVELPEDMLIETVQFDPAPEVRFMALAGLHIRLDPHLDEDMRVNAANLKAISKQALHDTSPHVRWQAKQILDALNDASSVLESEQSRHGGPQIE